MPQYTAPGDADAMRILQAELQKEQQTLATAGLDANSRARAQDNIRSMQAEITNFTKRTGIQPGTSSSTSSSYQAPQTSVRISGPVDPRAAIASGGIGEYVTNMIRSQMDAQDAAIREQQGAVTRQSQAEAATTAAQGDRSQQINTSRLGVQGAAGLGPMAQEDMYAMTMAALTQNDQRYREERAKYNELASKNVFEDPLGWVWAQLNIDTQGAKVNALADEESFLTSALQRNMMLSEQAETSIQIDTRATDAQIAKFQAQKELAAGQARVAALAAEGARANMTAAALYGGELRKDQKSESQLQEEELLRRMRQAKLQELEAQTAVMNNISAFTGSPAPERALDNMAPSEKAEVQSYAQGGIASPMTIVKHGLGLKTTPQGAPVYRTAQALNDLVNQEAQTYVTNRGSGNAVLAGKITWKPADDQQVAWNEIRSVLAASNSNRDPKTAITLTNPRWDKDFNPLRADHWAFADEVIKANAVGAPTPVSPRNLLVQMFKQTEKYPQARSKTTGQLTTEFERDAVLGAIGNLAVEGALKDSEGKPISPAGYAAMVSQYYQAATSWNQNRNQLQRMGFPEQKGYIASVPTRTLDGKSATLVVDLTRADEVERWLQQQIKINSAQRSQQELERKLFEQIGELPPARF